MAGPRGCHVVGMPWLGLWAAEIGVREVDPGVTGFQAQKAGFLRGRDPALLLDTEWAFIHAAKTAACPLARRGGAEGWGVSQPPHLRSPVRGEVGGTPTPVPEPGARGEVLRKKPASAAPASGLQDPWSVPIFPLRASSF